MPDDDYDDELETEQPSRNDRKEENLRQLREKARRADEAEAENQTLKRQLVFADAGLKLDPMKRKALEASHEGEWTPDAVRDTAVKLGWADAPPPDVPNDEFKAHDEIARAAAGAQPAMPEDFSAAIKACKTEGELDALLRSKFGTATATELGITRGSEN